MRPVGTGLELGVELAGHEPRMVRQLDDLDQAAIGRLTGQHHARTLERRAIAVVHLEPVAVSLVDDLLAVDRRGLRARGEARRIQTQPHRAALVLHVALVGHEVDHRVLGEHVELGRVGIARADDVAGELDDRALQPKAQTEVRDAVIPGVVGSEDLALDPTMAEPAGHEDAGHARQRVGDVLGSQLLGIDPAHLGIDAMGPRGMAERLGDRQVGIGQLDVLADEGDLERRLGRLDPLDEGAPAGQIRLGVGIAQV